MALGSPTGEKGWFAACRLSEHKGGDQTQEAQSQMFWEANPWKAGFLRSRSMKKGYRERASWPLTWRRAGLNDWPAISALGDDHDWARKMGTGFIAEFGDEVLFLIDRDWFGWPDPPQWGLASFYAASGEWQLWGNFSDLPSAWTVPEPLYGPEQTPA